MNEFVKAVANIIREEFFCLDFGENGKSGILIAGLLDNIVCIFEEEDSFALYVDDVKFINSDFDEVPLDEYRLDNIEGTRCLIIEKHLNSHDPLAVAKEITRLVDDIHNAFELEF